MITGDISARLILKVSETSVHVQTVLNNLEKCINSVKSYHRMLVTVYSKNAWKIYPLKSNRTYLKPTTPNEINVIVAQSKLCIRLIINVV